METAAIEITDVNKSRAHKRCHNLAFSLYIPYQVVGIKVGRERCGFLGRGCGERWRFKKGNQRWGDGVWIQKGVTGQARQKF